MKNKDLKADFMQDLEELFPLKRENFFLPRLNHDAALAVETRGIKAEEEHSVQFVGSECERTKQPSHIWALTRRE